MQRKYLILILAITAALLAGAAVVAYVVHTSGHSAQEKQDEYPTKKHAIFEDQTPTADPAIVGKWQNSDKQQWFRVYYDDYDGDGFFWGKEWDEAEDVREEDLMYHGNGWFRWRTNDKQLMEMHTMDANDVPIAKIYILLYSTPDSLVYCEQDRKSVIFHYSRVQ